MCSRIFGPAITPSLVIWPITTTDVSVCLAYFCNRAAHSRICETLPGDALDTLASLRDGGRKFGVVCVDPPAFIKRKKDAEQGLNAYRRVNDLGLQLVENGGILTSCSCSHHLEAEALRRLNTQLLYQGFQGPDHPVHPSMPETAYLKVFILRVWKD